MPYRYFNSVSVNLCRHSVQYASCLFSVFILGGFSNQWVILPSHYVVYHIPPPPRVHYAIHDDDADQKFRHFILLCQFLASKNCPRNPPKHNPCERPYFEIEPRFPMLCLLLYSNQYTTFLVSNFTFEFPLNPHILLLL